MVLQLQVEVAVEENVLETGPEKGKAETVDLVAFGLPIKLTEITLLPLRLAGQLDRQLIHIKLKEFIGWRISHNWMKIM